MKPDKQVGSTDKPGGSSSGGSARGVTLECDHCGDVAYEAPDGMVGDGEGDACISCGFPGHASVDNDEPIAWWSASDRADAVCRREDCEDCREVRAAQRANAAEHLLSPWKEGQRYGLIVASAEARIQGLPELADLLHRKAMTDIDDRPSGASEGEWPRSETADPPRWTEVLADEKFGALARYIVEHFRRRNRNELRDAIDAMTDESRSLLVEELTWILAHGGRPPNWVPDAPDTGSTLQWNEEPLCGVKRCTNPAHYDATPKRSSDG